MPRKRRQTAKPYQARSGGKSGFIRLFYDLLDSEAFHDLTPKQQILLVFCIRESHGRAMADNGGDERLFYMNRALRVEKHGLYADTDKRGFERDMAALIEHGFVDCVQSNYRSRERNLYRLSARWNMWGQPAFSVPDSVKTTHMRLAESRVKKTKDTRLRAP